MWNSPRKLLFFDDKDFVQSPITDTDKTRLSEGSGQSDTLIHVSQNVSTGGESSYAGITSHGVERSSLHGAVTSDVNQFTTSVYEIGPTPVNLGTSVFDSRRHVVGGRHSHYLPISLHEYSYQHVTSSHSYMDAENPSVMAVTRTSVTMVTTCSASRRFPAEEGFSEAGSLQQFLPTRLSSKQPEPIVSLNQPTVNDDLTRLKFEALGARPRSAVAPLARRPMFEDTAEEDASVQKLCSLMELQAQVSLHHGGQRASPHYGMLQTSARHGVQHISLPHTGQQICHHQSVQDDVESRTASPFLPFPGDTRLVTSEQCNFCKRNGERRSFYNSHKLQERGRVTCPILQRYVCPICGATGESAHTISYCPLGNGASSVAATRTQRKSCGCRRACKHGEEKRH